MPSTETSRIDGLQTSVAVKAPVRAATTANITLSGAQTVDGIAIVSGDRVLVKDQTSAINNGIYVADSGTWSRALDFDGNRDAVKGTTVFVTGGTVNGQTYWYISSSTPVIGTDSITWTQAPIAAGGTGTMATQNANAVAITGGTITGITDLAVADGGTGASTFTSNAILKGNGAGALVASGVSIDANNAISGYRSKIVTDAGTSITLSEATHGGRTLVCTSGTAVAITVPNTLGEGCVFKVIQDGAGQITFSGGATIQNRQSHTKTAAQRAAVVLEVVTNSGGTSAIVNLAGDTAA